MKLGVRLKKKAAKNLQVSRETCRPLIFVLLRSSLFLLSDYLGPKQHKCRAVGGGGGGGKGGIGGSSQVEATLSLLLSQNYIQEPFSDSATQNSA